ncbi:RNA polymerase sigma factor [Daejeonella oryzae]|uniref:RNA polymerase sigma factor n=1 Tax=Daejeonella oryzae TaxID=1122943 RepID=UPI000414401B|nr:sigma-70 family RNA polymerase sigma factor [Daejeonella oryzae]
MFNKPTGFPKSDNIVFGNDLIILFQNGSKTAFVKLYDTYAPSLLGAISRIINDKHEAETILQKSFGTVWQNRKQYNPEKERIFTWLVKIARLTCSKLKVEGKSKCNEIKESINLVYACNVKEYLFEKQRREGRGFTSGIEKKYAEALDLIYFKDFTFADAAAHLNIPVSILRSDLVSAIKKLQGTALA